MAKPIIFDILAVDEASRTFTKVGLAAQGMGTKVESAGKVASRGFLYAGVAAGALGIHAIKMAGNFDAAMVRLETTAGESHNALKMVGDGLLNMAGKVGYSAEALAKGMYIVESAGYHGAAGLKVMEAAAKGARVEGADLGDTANAVSSLLVDYHLNASDAARVTNVLTAAVGHGKTTFQQMATALPNVAAAGASAKISMEEVASAIATMTMHGTDAAKAGTYLRQVIGQMEAPSAKASSVMESLGINVNKLGLTLSSGSGHGLADAIRTIDDAIRKHLAPSGLVALDTFTKSKKPISDYKKVLADLPGDYTTAFGALSKMVGGVKSLQGFLQLGGENLKTYRNNVKAVREQVKGGGNDVEGFAQQQKTFNGKLADAQGAASAFSVSLGHDLMPAASATMGVFSKFVGVLVDHHEAASKVVIVLTAVGGAMAAVKVATAGAAVATSMLGGEEGILAIKMTASAVAAGEFRNAAAGASLAMGAMGTAVRVASGVAGMGLLAASSSTTNNTLGLLGKTAAGATLGFSVGGPWGAAIGTGAGLIVGLASASSTAATEMIGAAHATEHWVTALQGLTDARNAQARSEAANTVQKQESETPGSAAAVRDLGIKTRDLTSYITGEGDARKRLNRIVAEGLKQPMGSVQQRNAALTQLLLDSLSGEGRLLTGVIKKNREHAAAVSTWAQALKGVPKNVQAELKNKNYSLTLSQVAALEKKYTALSNKQVTTILAALGYNVTAKQLDTLMSKAGALGKQHPVVKVAVDTGGANAELTALMNRLNSLSSRAAGGGGGRKHKAAPAPKGVGGLLNGPMQRTTGTSYRMVANSLGDRLVPGFHDTARSLSAVFIDNLAAGVVHGKVKLSTALDKVKAIVTSETSKLQGILSKRTDVVNGFLGMTSSVFSQDFSTTGGASVAGLISYQQQQLQQALQVQADVAKLVSEGLSKALVLQEANSGATGIANLHALAMGSPSDIATLNSLNAQTTSALTAAGMTAGNSVYGTQIQAASRDQATAQAIVRELTKWRHQEDKNTVIQLAVGAKTVQATLLELKRHNGNKPLGLS